MGREIRRVPPNWQHPQNEKGYIPMVDQTFEEARLEWEAGAAKWRDETHEAFARWGAEHPSYFQWTPPPGEEDGYRPAYEAEPTWWQLYETVSEGTPVTPPFATAEELVDYLTAKGTFWDRKPWSRTAAEQMVKSGFVPSAMFFDGRVYVPGDVMP